MGIKGDALPGHRPDMRVHSFRKLRAGHGLAGSQARGQSLAPLAEQIVAHCPIPSPVCKSSRADVPQIVPLIALPA
jgi:hypothetical protein